VFVALVGPFMSIGAAVFVVDETHCINVMDLYRELDVFQHHLVIVHAARQRNDVEVVISKTDCDPRLQEFLQAIVHAMDDERVAVNDGFLGHVLKDLAFAAF